MSGFQTSPFRSNQELEAVPRLRRALPLSRGEKGLLIRQKHLYSILKFYFFLPYSSLKKPEGWDSAAQRSTKFNFMFTQLCTRVFGGIEVPIAGSAVARSPSDQAHATSSFPNVPLKTRRVPVLRGLTSPLQLLWDLLIFRCPSHVVNAAPHRPLILHQRLLTRPSATKGLCGGPGGSSSSYSSA